MTAPPAMPPTGTYPFAPSPYLPNSPLPQNRLTPDSPDFWNCGFHRLISIFQSPPFGAGFLSISIFFLILFSSDIILKQAIFATLGIIVTLSTLGLLALVVFILFLL